MATIFKINSYTYAVMIKLLLEGTRTCQELADETGLHKGTVYQHCRELHKVGVIHIAAWMPDSMGRDCLKVYCFGSAPDAHRHKDMAVVRTARYRAKQHHLKMIQALAA